MHASQIKRGKSGASEDCERERHFQIDAAIVRVMKARRRLNHQELGVEVYNQLKLFRPDPKMVKSRIEDLILREYLERDEKDNRVYIYKA